MMFGLLELLIIVAVIGVVGSICVGLGNAISSQSETGSTWVKILATFFGVQILIGLGYGVYFFRANQVAHQRAIVEEARARHLTEQARVEAEMHRLETELKNDGLLEEETHGDDEPESSTKVHSESEEVKETIVEHQHEEHSHHESSRIQNFEWHADDHHHGEPVAAVATWAVVGAAVLAFVALGTIGTLIWRKNAGLAALMIGAFVCAGLFFTVASSHTTEMRPTVSLDHVAATQPVVMTMDTSESTNIPVTDSEIAAAQEPKWTSITELDYDNTNVSRQEVAELPEWVEKYDTQQIIPSRNEVILHSKRYATVEEAEAELRPIAVALVHDLVSRTYPQLRDDSPDPLAMWKSGVLDEAVHVTYPLPGFEEEVYQVHWKLTADHEVKEKLLAHWEESELIRRLTYLGGGVGILTLFSGVGAVAARRREQKAAA